ncbi:AI-2E family transporter [Thomasclavelia cocleata]|uniref:AI-2E family transporter n=1 Tax=Thomasclavelia cocleata TaxID=69824 RepID=UPI002557C9C1|nr:AI-2E family transporter [Thomasclavelia cocleata]
MRNLLDEDLKKQVKPGIVISAFTVFLIYFLINIGNIYSVIAVIMGSLKYLFYGIIIAYIINQPMKLIEGQIEKRCKKESFVYGKKRGIAIALTLILMLLLIAVIASIVIPNLVNSLVSLISNISSFLVNVFDNIDEVFIYFDIDFRMEDIGSVKNLINMPWQDMVSQALNILSKSAGGIMANATDFLSKFGIVFTGFIFSLYLLGNKETFLRQLRKVIGAVCGYRVTKIIFNYAHKTNEVFSSFISGQLTEACILWVLYYITMRLFGFPYPELIATIISIFSFVPFFGPIAAMFVGAILILSKDALLAIWFMIYFQVLSQLEDNFIYPKVVGNSVGLPGIWVLLSIFVFGNFFGIFGMVIAVPSAACLYSMASELVNKILKKRKLKITETMIEKVE